MEAKATQKHIRRSAQKIRLVVDLVRGKQVDKALNSLKFTNKAAANEVAKVITSAAANIRDKFQDERLENEDLIISSIFVNEGTSLKRIQPAPQGRAHPILKRTSHVTVVVAKKESES